MDYKSHVPAGIAITAGVTAITGMPVYLSFLLGGAIGGALPDIDVENSAVEKLGSKAAQKANSIVGGKRSVAKTIVSTLGALIDIPLKILARIWRFTAKNIMGRIYLAIYDIGGNDDDDSSGDSSSGECLGKKLGWDGERSPWSHRGGLTHSLTFLITSSIVLLPLSWLLGTWWFWAGIMLGIISHLICDAMCVSGTKFFWPWKPAIGFKGDNKRRGDDVRLLPYAKCVHTGWAGKSNTEIEQDAHGDAETIRTGKKWRRREKMWRYIIQCIMVLLLALIFYGVAIGDTTFSWGASSTPLNFGGSDSTTIAVSTNATNNDDNSSDSGSSGDDSSSSASNDTSSTTDSTSTDASSSEIISDPELAASVAGVNPVDDTEETTNTDGTITVDEHAGPTSLTYGDLDVSDLPAGIMKMPDESLYVIGVGEVNSENLNNEKWSFTDEEKAMLLAAATAQRINDLPDTISSAVSDAADTVTETTSSWLSQLLSLFGLSSENTGIFGFQGLTPYTSSSSSNADDGE